MTGMLNWLRAIGAGPAADSRSRSARWGEVAWLYAASVLAALTLAALLVAATGGSWQDVYTAMLDGAFIKPGRWGQSLGFMAPILLVTLGTIVSGRAGLINIGQEGQVVMGAAFAGYAGVRIGGPGPLVLVLALLFGVLGGALWAGIAGGLRFWRKVPEVLSTLLLIVVAQNLLGFGLKHPELLLAPAAGRANRNLVSESLAPDARIPRVTWFGNEFPISLFIAIGLACVLAFLLARSLPGFRLRILGRNPAAAQRAGVSETSYGMAAMLISGGFAGLAGGMMLAGGDFGDYQLVANFGVGIGSAGLLAALVARGRVLPAIFVAFVFGSLRNGAGWLKSTGLEARITDVVQGLLVLSLLIPPAILYIRARRRALAATEARV